MQGNIWPVQPVGSHASNDTTIIQAKKALNIYFQDKMSQISNIIHMQF